MARSDVQTDDVGVTEVEVVLSERNLLVLLSKLYTKGSKATIINTDVFRNGEPVSDYQLVIKAEQDEAHYGKREHGPGPMHPITEQLVNILKQAKVTL